MISHGTRLGWRLVWIVASVVFFCVPLCASECPGLDQSGRILVIDPQSSEFQHGMYDSFLLKDFSDILPDPEEKLTIADVTSQPWCSKFQPLQDLDASSAGFSDLYWLRVTIDNSLDTPDTWYFSSAGSEWVVYLEGETGQYLAYRSGVMVPRSERAFPDMFRRFPLVPVTIEPHQRQNVYVRVDWSGRKIHVEPWIGLMGEHIIKGSHEFFNLSFQIFFSGFLVSICLYHLVLFVIVRDRSYIYYALYSICIPFVYLCEYGYDLQYFYPEHPQVRLILYYSIISLGHFFTNIFVQSYLHTRKHTPKWNFIINVLSVLFLLWLPFTYSNIFFFHGEYWGVLRLVTVIAYIAYTAVGIISWRRGYKPARIFLVAGFLAVVGSMMEIMVEFRILPLTYVTHFSAQVGILIQQFLYAVGLAERINLLRAEKEQAQEEAMLSQKLAITNLEKADRLKDEFLANTSHELRTPLTGIIGLAESLIDGATGKLSELTRRNLAMIISSGKRLTSLVNDILDFSKLRHQELALDRKSVDMCQLTDIVVRLSQSLVSKRNLSLRNTIPFDLPAAFADENRVLQILHNLIGNAIKFTESGSITIGAVVRSGFIEIWVKDRGIGIAEEQQKSIFHSFEQADASTARAYGGTGLGLTITKQLVELHGGSIWVESRVGEGSTFYFTLPASDKPVPQIPTDRSIEMELTRIVPETEPVSVSMVSEGDRTAAECKVLVVDDEPINLQVLTNHLSLNNYTVHHALDGFQALEMLDKEKFDLILLDIMMPRMSGYEVCRKIRLSYKPSKLPVIMITAKNQVVDLVEGFSSGANDYLAKPFSKQELMARIKTHLNLSRINLATERFVPNEFLRTLGRESVLDVQLGDQIQGRMTVSFSDIRGFTTISESLTPKQIFDFLNDYLSRVIPEIRKNRGYIDKYLGDGIMAVFPDSADDALEAAINSTRIVHQYSENRVREGLFPIRIGTGIHTGDLMLGTIGDRERMDGTVISDAVNVASRLEDLTKQFGVTIIISGQCLDSISDDSKRSIRSLGTMNVKGKTIETPLYEVFAADEQTLRDHKLDTRPEFEKAVSLYCAKQFSEAGPLFQKLLDREPQDEPANYFLETINNSHRS